MSSKDKPNVNRGSARVASPLEGFGWPAAIVAVMVLGGVGAVVLLAGMEQASAAAAPSAALGANPPSRVQTSNAPAEPPTMLINQAVMVTVELDFGAKIPSIAEALREVERRSQPADGRGRTFAIIDAYGEPTTNGKLHLSMHVSSEKAGLGALLFRRTGEILWQSRIMDTNAGASFTGKNLKILMDNGTGTNDVTIDGSAHPTSILDAPIKDMGIPVRLFWPDGAAREFTFMYSACGCPVKAMVKREGERTVRTREMPVMFPDDPAVLVLISRLMRWR